MATHRVLVWLHDGREMCEPDQLVTYDGPPDWKREPLDAAEHARWEKETADPARVMREGWKQRRGLPVPSAETYTL